MYTSNFGNDQSTQDNKRRIKKPNTTSYSSIIGSSNLNSYKQKDEPNSKIICKKIVEDLKINEELNNSRIFTPVMIDSARSLKSKSNKKLEVKNLMNHARKKEHSYQNDNKNKLESIFTETDLIKSKNTDFNSENVNLNSHSDIIQTDLNLLKDEKNKVKEKKKENQNMKSEEFLIKIPLKSMHNSRLNPPLKSSKYYDDYKSSLSLTSRTFDQTQIQTKKNKPTKSRDKNTQEELIKSVSPDCRQKNRANEKSYINEVDKKHKATKISEGVKHTQLNSQLNDKMIKNKEKSDERHKRTQSIKILETKRMQSLNSPFSNIRQDIDESKDLFHISQNDTIKSTDLNVIKSPKNEKKSFKSTNNYSSGEKKKTKLLRKKRIYTDTHQNNIVTHEKPNNKKIIMKMPKSNIEEKAKTTNQINKKTKRNYQEFFKWELSSKILEKMNSNQIRSNLSKNNIYKDGLYNLIQKKSSNKNFSEEYDEEKCILEHNHRKQKRIQCQKKSFGDHKQPMKQTKSSKDIHISNKKSIKENTIFVNTINNQDLTLKFESGYWIEGFPRYRCAKSLEILAEIPNFAENYNEIANIYSTEHKNDESTHSNEANLVINQIHSSELDKFLEHSFEMNQNKFEEKSNCDKESSQNNHAIPKILKDDEMKVEKNYSLEPRSDEKNIIKSMIRQEDNHESEYKKLRIEQDNVDLVVSDTSTPIQDIPTISKGKNVKYEHKILQIRDEQILKWKEITERLDKFAKKNDSELSPNAKKVITQILIQSEKNKLDLIEKKNKITIFDDKDQDKVIEKSDDSDFKMYNKTENQIAKKTKHIQSLSPKNLQEEKNSKLNYFPSANLAKNFVQYDTENNTNKTDINNSSNMEISQIRIIFASEKFIKEQSSGNKNNADSPQKKMNSNYDSPNQIEFESLETSGLFQRDPFQNFKIKKLKELTLNENMTQIFDMREKVLEARKTTHEKYMTKLFENKILSPKTFERRKIELERWVNKEQDNIKQSKIEISNGSMSINEAIKSTQKDLKFLQKIITVAENKTHNYTLSESLKLVDKTNDQIDISDFHQSFVNPLIKNPRFLYNQSEESQNFSANDFDNKYSYKKFLYKGSKTEVQPSLNGIYIKDSDRVHPMNQQDNKFKDELLKKNEESSNASQNKVAIKNEEIEIIGDLLIKKEKNDKFMERRNAAQKNQILIDTEFTLGADLEPKNLQTINYLLMEKISDALFLDTVDKACLEIELLRSENSDIELKLKEALNLKNYSSEESINRNISDNQARNSDIIYVDDTNRYNFDDEFFYSKKLGTEVNDDEIAIEFKGLGIETDMTHINNYLNQLMSWITEYYKDEFLNFMNTPIGLTSQEKLKSLYSYDSNSEENQENNKIFHTPILNIDLYLSLEQAIMDSKPESNEITIELEHIHNKMLFDCFNECLDSYRKFGLIGRPYAWNNNLQIYINQSISQEKVYEILEKCRVLVLEWSQYQCGFLGENFNHGEYIPDEYLFQFKEQRLWKMLNDETVESEKRWTDYNDEETEIKLELSDLIFDHLINELCSELGTKKIDTIY